MATVEELRVIVKTQQAELKALKKELRDTVRELKRSQAETKKSASTIRGLESRLSSTSDRLNRTRGRLRDFQRDLRRGRLASDEFNNSILKFGRTLASFAAVFYTLKNAFRVVGWGLEFNKMIEDTHVGLTALIASTHDYTTANGKAVSSVDAFNAAAEDATELQTQLRIAGIKTAATYEELSYALQQAFVPATKAGFKLEQLVGFAQRFAQVMQVVGIPMNQIGEEMRSFLTATGTPRTTRTMPFFEGLGLGREEVRKLLAEGKLAEEYFKRTWAVQMMAAKASKNWTVALSNLKDALQNAVGTGSQQLFSNLKQTFLDLTAQIVTMDEKLNMIEFNPDFMDAIKAIDTRLSRAVTRVREFAETLNRLRKEHPVATRTALEIADIVGSVAMLIGSLSILYGLGKWLGSKIFKQPFQDLFALFTRFSGMWKRLPPIAKKSLILIGIYMVWYFREAIAKLAKMFWDWLKEFNFYGKPIKDWAADAKKAIIKKFAELRIDLPTLMGTVGRVAGEAYNKAWEKARKLDKRATEIDKYFYDRMFKQHLPAVGAGVVDLWKRVGQELEEFSRLDYKIPISIPLFSDAEPQFASVSELWAGFTEQITRDWNEMLSTLESEFGFSIENWKAGMTEFGSHFYDAVMDTWERIKQFLPFEIPISLNFGDLSKAYDDAKKALGIMTAEEAARKVASLQPMVNYGTEASWEMTWSMKPKEHEYLKKAVDLTRKARNQADKDTKGGGGGGGGADKENSRLLSMYDSIMKQYLKFSETTYDAAARAHEEMIDKILNGKEREVTEAEVVALENKRFAAEVKDMQLKYDVMVAKSSGDKYAEITEQAKAMLDQWGNLQGRDAEAFVESWKRRQRAMYDLELQNKYLEGQNKILKAVEDLTPGLAGQLELQKKQLANSAQIAVNEIERQRLNGDITDDLAAQLTLVEQQTYQLQQQVLARKAWMTQGALGGVKTGLYERVGEADTTLAEATKAWMLGIEGTVTETLAAGIVGALNGTRMDFQKVGMDIAQAFVEKSITMLTTELWNVLWKALSQAFDLSIPTAEIKLAAGGVQAGNSIMTGSMAGAAAIRAAADYYAMVVSMAHSGAGGGGGGLGGILSLFSKGATASDLWLDVPYWQHGGVVTKPTLGVAGEAGPEAIIPLDRLSTGEGTGDVNVTVINETGVAVKPDVKIDERAIIIRLKREIIQDVNKGGEFDRALTRKYAMSPKLLNRGG